MLERLAGALDLSGLPPGQLQLEITELAVNQDPDGAVIQLQRLKDMGVRVALDNFGSGLASLNHLLRLPLDLVKLDRRLTASLPTRGRQGVLIDTICGFCRHLHMRVQADGVETQAQLHELQQLGCDLGQGHLFALPMSADDITVLLARGGMQPPTESTGASPVLG
jgi:EAL domain-containing protein (putative c-di-GMP-specific phosphodiesterase class I)